MGSQISGQIRLSNILATVENSGVLGLGEQFYFSVVEDRRLLRQFAGLFIFIGQAACFNLCGFHIRLIERVDADDDPATAVAISQVKNCSAAS